MARNTEAAPNTFAVWKKLLSWVYRASDPHTSFLLSFFLDLARLIPCIIIAIGYEERSSWLNPTPLPNDCYLSPRVNSLFQPLYVLAVLMVILYLLCTIAFSIMMFRRETTYTEAIWLIAVIMISIMVAAITLALQTLIQPSLDMQTILTVRPDLSSKDVLSAWDDFMCGRLLLGIFILSLVTGGFQIMAVSARHLIPSPNRLPKQFQPFVMEKHKRKSSIEEPEASTLGTELVAGVEPGPLARLFDDYEKRALISTHVDLEVCQSNKAITFRFLHGFYRLSTLPDLEWPKD